MYFGDPGYTSPFSTQGGLEDLKAIAQLIIKDNILEKVGRLERQHFTHSSLLFAHILILWFSPVHNNMYLFTQNINQITFLPLYS